MARLKKGELFIVCNDGRCRRATKLICTNCGKEFIRKNSSIRKGNQFCTHKCSTDYRKNKIILNCNFCGKEFKRKPSKVGKLNFCSTKCYSDAHRIENGIIKPSHYSDGKHVYRQIAFRNHGKKCSHCGYSEFEEGLDVHHIDGDRSNNNIDNLLVLCGTHHILVTRGIFKVINRNLSR